MYYTYEYPRPSMTADIIIVHTDTINDYYSRNYDKFNILFIRRGGEPFKGKLALPGGFMNMYETSRQCAARELEEETGLSIPEDKLSFLNLYDAVDRDTRGRVVSACYYNCFVNVERPKIKAGDDAAAFEWRSFTSVNYRELAFDHYDMLCDFYDRMEG